MLQRANILYIYYPQEIRTPQTGSGTDRGEDTPGTWPYYMAMHEALGARPSMSPPVLVASCLANPTMFPSTSESESNPGPSCPSPTSPLDPSNSPLVCPSSPRPGCSGSPQPPVPKRRRNILTFLEKESEKEDKRQEEFSRQTERLVSAFEKMVDKM